jgi:hypothetical protein
MEPVNRTTLLVTPKRRFLEWANALEDAGEPLRADELSSLRTAYLVATGDVEPDLQEVIDTYWDEIFDDFLRGWAVDESLWPGNRTPHIFRDWFALEYIGYVADADSEEPFTVAEAAATQCAMCGETLDETRIAVALGDAIRPMTAAEVDEWERAARTGEEPSIDAELILRCCGPACAQRAEETLDSVRAEQTGPRPSHRS